MSDEEKPPEQKSGEHRPHGRYSGPERQTEEVPKVSIIEGLLRAMQREVQDGFEKISTDQVHTDAKLARLENTIHIIGENQKTMGTRVGILEQRVSHASGNIRAVKASDSEQGEALALEQKRSSDLEHKLESLQQKYDTEITAARAEIVSVRCEMTAAKTLAEETKKTADETKALAASALAIAENTKTLAEDTKKTADETKTLAEGTKKTADETKTLAEDTKKLTEEQTTILNRLATVANHPHVKELVRVAVTAAVVAFTAWLAVRGH